MSKHKTDNYLLVRLMIVLLCFHSQYSQEESNNQTQDFIPPKILTIDRKEQVRQQQLSSRSQNKMNYENIETYTVKLQQDHSFYVTPQADQQIQCQLYIYWQSDNTFIGSQYKEGEEVRIVIIENGERMIHDRMFYMFYGLTFDAKKGSEYQIRFLSKGMISKLLSLLITKMLDASKPLLNSSDVISKEQKIHMVQRQIQAFFSIAQRNYIVEKSLTEQILKSSQLYMGYQILEMILVLLIAVLQTVFISKILRSNSIV